MFERYFNLLVRMWYGLIELCLDVFDFLTEEIEFAGETFAVFDVLFAGSVGLVLSVRLVAWLADLVIPS